MSVDCPKKNFSMSMVFVTFPRQKSGKLAHVLGVRREHDFSTVGDAVDIKGKRPMPETTGLRDRVDLLMSLADQTVDRNLRLSLESQALALAQSAEEIAREEGRIQIIADAIVWNRQPQEQRGFFPLEPEPAAREIMKRLANAGYKIVPISR
jgi:hypothetical protein